MHHEAGASIAMHPAGIQCSSDVVFTLTLLQHRNVGVMFNGHHNNVGFTTLDFKHYFNAILFFGYDVVKPMSILL